MTRACKHHEAYRPGGLIKCRLHQDDTPLAQCVGCKSYRASAIPAPRRRVASKPIGETMRRLLAPIGESCAPCRKTATQLDSMSPRAAWRDRKKLAAVVYDRVKADPSALRWRLLRKLALSLPRASKVGIVITLAVAIIISKARNQNT